MVRIIIPRKLHFNIEWTRMEKINPDIWKWYVMCMYMVCVCMCVSAISKVFRNEKSYNWACCSINLGHSRINFELLLGANEHITAHSHERKKNLFWLPTVTLASWYYKAHSNISKSLTRKCIQTIWGILLLLVISNSHYSTSFHILVLVCYSSCLRRLLLLCFHFVLLYNVMCCVLCAIVPCLSIQIKNQ